ncbi:hypothetical protein Acid345_1447 [Candidatus Koribacter versatilis Ellin345]|uniref:Uncharacterized protein n=1 Tax=Koribacter versatilis (strain Ellin345) TaxID=204669 RepID=Q1IRQ1_KORVE|nr:hypothetical protein [Candidatus Koribacter versatilis]ABF40449.1 hypothetical protein Acid345_1447 [Candidatus Koribacter versatilis Ellin345]
MELITGITGAAAQPEEEVRPELEPRVDSEITQSIPEPEMEAVDNGPPPSLEERSYSLVGRALRFVMKTVTPNAWQNVVQKMAAQLPAKIDLVPTEQEWTHELRHRQLVEELIDQGFTDAGMYRAEVMRANLHLLVNETYDIRAVVYEHEHSGVVLDLVTLFGDGTGITYVNREDPGYESSPLHPNVYLGNVQVFELLDKCLRDRPKKARLPENPATAARLMELEYEFGTRRLRGQSVNPIEIADAYLDVIEKADAVKVPEVPEPEPEPAKTSEPVKWTGRPHAVLPPLHEAIGLAAAEHKPANGNGQSKAASANSSK